MSSDLERRAVAELRADHTRIVGHAVALRRAELADLGGFVEIVRAAGRGPRAAPERRHPRALQPRPGRGAGPHAEDAHVAKDARGLAFTLDPANTTAGRDAFELVRRGDVTGASFGFKTLKDAWHAGGRVDRA